MSLTPTTKQGGVKLKEGVTISRSSTVLATGSIKRIELNRLEAILETYSRATYTRKEFAGRLDIYVNGKKFCFGNKDQRGEWHKLGAIE